MMNIEHNVWLWGEVGVESKECVVVCEVQIIEFVTSQIHERVRDRYNINIAF